MYKEHNGNTIIRKHWVLLILYLIKFVFIILIALILSFIWTFYREALGNEIVLYVIFPLVLVLVNYSFFKLVLWIIEYYNYLFVISWDQIFIINASLILRNDIEVIDAFKIIKLDAYTRWFISNILWYGKLVVELQTKEERLFRFMPHPYTLLKYLQEQREEVLENRKKKYIVDDVVADK